MICQKNKTYLSHIYRTAMSDVIYHASTGCFLLSIGSHRQHHRWDNWKSIRLNWFHSDLSKPSSNPEPWNQFQLVRKFATLHDSYCMSIIHGIIHGSHAIIEKSKKTYKHSVNGSKSSGLHVTRLSSDIKKENLIFWNSIKHGAVLSERHMKFSHGPPIRHAHHS